MNPEIPDPCFSSDLPNWWCKGPSYKESTSLFDTTLLPAQSEATGRPIHQLLTHESGKKLANNIIVFTLYIQVFFTK